MNLPPRSEALERYGKQTGPPNIGEFFIQIKSTATATNNGLKKPDFGIELYKVVNHQPNGEIVAKLVAEYFSGSEEPLLPKETTQKAFDVRAFEISQIDQHSAFCEAAQELQETLDSSYYKRD